MAAITPTLMNWDYSSPSSTQERTVEISSNEPVRNATSEDILLLNQQMELIRHIIDCNEPGVVKFLNENPHSLSSRLVRPMQAVVKETRRNSTIYRIQNCTIAILAFMCNHSSILSQVILACGVEMINQSIAKKYKEKLSSRTHGTDYVETRLRTLSYEDASESVRIIHPLSLCADPQFCDPTVSSPIFDYLLHQNPSLNYPCISSVRGNIFNITFPNILEALTRKYAINELEKIFSYHSRKIQQLLLDDFQIPLTIGSIVTTYSYEFPEVASQIALYCKVRFQYMNNEKQLEGSCVIQNLIVNVPQHVNEVEALQSTNEKITTLISNQFNIVILNFTACDIKIESPLTTALQGKDLKPEDKLHKRKTIDLLLNNGARTHIKTTITNDKNINISGFDHRQHPLINRRNSSTTLSSLAI